MLHLLAVDGEKHRRLAQEEALVTAGWCAAKPVIE